MDPAKFKVFTGRLDHLMPPNKQQFWKREIDTVKSTKMAMTALTDYIAAKGLKTLNDHTDDKLPGLLNNFYCDARTQKGELYHVSTLKPMRSNMNRWFKENRNIDIIEDVRFTRSNMMFKGSKVRSKKAGKGTRKSTLAICEEDMKSLADYFNMDHFQTPNPAVLQRNIIFNTLYYFCHRGKENLNEMQKNWFKIEVDPQGSKYIIQNIDELDKNHDEDDLNLTNQGKIYKVPGT